MHRPYPVLSTTPPIDSEIARHLSNAYFYDAWQVRAARPELSLPQQFHRAFSQTPSWVKHCMTIRNQLVSRLGLKNLGDFDQNLPETLATAQADSVFQVGQRIGIFRFLAQTEHEFLVEDNDKHLRVILSLHRDLHDALTLTTVVHVHNLWGKLYMLPVTPMHKLIAPASLKILGRP